MELKTWHLRAAGGVLLVAVAALRWFGSPAVGPVCSLPVAVWAVSDGARGGLASAVLCSMLLFAAPGNSSTATVGVLALVLLTLGLTVGLLFDRERRQRASFETSKRMERLSALGQLSAGLAHEIRNPLAGIAGAASILKRNLDLDAKQTRCIGIIESECQRLDGLLTTFLNFAGPRPPRIQKVDLHTVLDNVLELAGHGVRGDRVPFEKRAAALLPVVECDPEQLEQVLLNLLLNAVEASPDGQTVTLAASAEGGKVTIQVIDRGHGVAPAHIDRLFDPFFTTKEHGTGLGLPVAHQIVTRMGGTLLAEPNQESGMIFTVLLPATHGKA